MYKNLNKRDGYMLKKLVAGTLVAGVALTGGLGTVSAEEKSNTIKSFDYLKVDEQNVNSLTKLSLSR